MTVAPLFRDRPVDAAADVVDELAAEDLHGLPDEGLKAGVVDLVAVYERLGVEVARRVGEVDARDATAADGFVSVTSWLRERCRVTAGRARSWVRLGRALRRLPRRTAHAAEVGDVGLDHVRVLADAHKAHPEVYARDEEILVDAATRLDASHLWRLIEHWRSAAEPDAALATFHRRRDRRSFNLSRTLDGMGRSDGVFDPEGTEVVLRAIRALAEPAGRDPGDTRTPGQRRADALVEICRFFLDHGNAPLAGGEKPHLSVIVDLETLEGRAGYRAETEDGEPLHPETLRRWACDARISRIITAGRSQPLDVGRASRTVTSAQRRALVVRDGGCVHPGCDRPPRWCDVHHKVPWVLGGETNLDDLELRCRPHHIQVHEGTPGRPGVGGALE